MTPIEPTEIRYFKLGIGGCWARRGIDHGEMHFGYSAVSQELCLKQDWDAVVQILIAEGRSPGKAKDGAREIREFYTFGSDCLWVTFADGHLYWAFAEPRSFGSAPTMRPRAPVCARRLRAGIKRTSRANRCAATA